MLYRNNLKNREFGKKAPQILDSERATIAEGQGANENQKCEVRPTQPKTDSLGYFGITYREAGVDVAKGDTLVERLQKFNPDIGGFGGLYPLGDDFLVAGTDGVGTKLKLAFELNHHETVGIDLVAMCVNDVITTGAKPLFLLDYFATSQLDVDQAESVLLGVMAGCREAECVLLGGETAEMPGFYKAGEYDIAGFAVGIVKKKDLIDGKTIQPGDVLVGLPSSGLHSNGFSLVREALRRSGTDPDLSLLTPTRIYVRDIFEILSGFKIKGMAHITGGGLSGNVPRMLPPGLTARLQRGSWDIPQVFEWLEERGRIDKEEMYNTFNMGIGMVLALDPREAASLLSQRKDCVCIGEIVLGKEGFSWL